ncbi:MAG: hypothetical protein AAF310_00330 [Myxococcota bacterium]
MQQQVQVVAQQLPQVGMWEVAVPVLAFVAVVVLPSLFALRVMFGALMQPQQSASEA